MDGKDEGNMGLSTQFAESGAESFDRRESYFEYRSSKNGSNGTFDLISERSCIFEHALSEQPFPLAH